MAWHNVATDFTTASTNSPKFEYSLRGIRQILDMKSANTAVGKEELRSHLDVIGAISAISLDLVASAGNHLQTGYMLSAEHVSEFLRYPYYVLEIVLSAVKLQQLLLG